MNQESSQALSLFARRLHQVIWRLASFETGVLAPRRQDACVTEDAAFNDLALELFRLQLIHNPACARLCDPCGSGSLSHWTQLPAVPAVAFKELEMTAIAAQARARVFHSSGTTNQRPSRHFHHAESLALYEASMAAWYEHHLGSVAKGPRMIFLTPPLAQAPHSSLVHMFETLGRRAPDSRSLFAGQVKPDGSWSLNTERINALFEVSVQSGEPLALLGTAFNFVPLLEELTGQGRSFQLPAGSRVMETGGYKGRTRVMPKPELHRWISDRLGIPGSHVISEYGMSELSSQAYDHAIGHPLDSEGSGQRLFRFPPWARSLVVSPETNHPVQEGETGLIRVIDLANVWSALAVQTEDLGIRQRDGFELIGRASLAESRGCSLQTA